MANNADLKGPLPLEVGELPKLEGLYLSSTGIFGPLPCTLASSPNLVNLEAHDTAIEGCIDLECVRERPCTKEEIVAIPHAEL